MQVVALARDQHHHGSAEERDRGGLVFLSVRCSTNPASTNPSTTSDLVSMTGGSLIAARASIAITLRLEVFARPQLPCPI